MGGTPNPDDYSLDSIWRIVMKPSKAGQSVRAMECVYGTGGQRDLPSNLLQTFDLHAGDCFVKFTHNKNGTPLWVTVPYKEFGGRGSLGSIYVREKEKNGGLVWKRVVDRSKLVKNDLKKKKGSEKASLHEECLAAIEAEVGDVICTGRSPEGTEDAQSWLNVHPAFRFRFVTVNGLEEVGAEIRAALLDYKVNLELNEQLKEELKKLLEAKKYKDDKLDVALGKFFQWLFSKKGAEWIWKDGADPDVQAGSPELNILTGFVAGCMVAADDANLNAAQWADGANMAQGLGFEAISEIWQFCTYGSALHVVNKKIEKLESQIKARKDRGVTSSADPEMRDWEYHVKQLEANRIQLRDRIGATSVKTVNSLFNSAYSMADMILKTPDVVNTALGAAGAAAAFAGVVSGGVAAGFHFKEVAKSVKLKDKAITLFEDMNGIIEGDDPGDPDLKLVAMLSAYVKQKLKRRVDRRISLGTFSVVGALGSAIGGSAAVTGVVLGATAAAAAVAVMTPIGWALLGAAAAAGLGVGIYVLTRKLTKKHRYRHRIAKGVIVNAEDFALKLLTLYTSHSIPMRGGKPDMLHGKAYAMLQLFKVNPDTIAKDKKSAIAKIKEHFAS
jgi:hypothetical protein